MRPLTEEETKSVFESTSTTVGDSRARAGDWYSRARQLYRKELGPSYRPRRGWCVLFQITQGPVCLIVFEGSCGGDNGTRRTTMIYARRTQETEGEGNEEERGRARVQGPRLTTRVYYLPVAMLHLATSVARSNLISLGTCFGKFSKTGKFKLGITSLDWLAKYAKYKVRYSPLFLFHHAVQRPGGIYQDGADFRYG